MYLVDTNVWLERLLAQQRAAEVARFLNDTPSENLWITDFSFHSIGVLLTRLKQGDALVAVRRWCRGLVQP
jgi:predicted nucleic acid-binding protein